VKTAAKCAKSLAQPRRYQIPDPIKPQRRDERSEENNFAISALFASPRFNVWHKMHATGADSDR
jgi:hypothetical protein